MAIYTGIADANGDFTVPFSSNYTGGQKVTVIAEKDGAEKTIELHAPSEVVGGGGIQFGGSFVDFPMHIGNVKLVELSGSIQSSAFEISSAAGSLSYYAKGLDLIETTVTSIQSRAFYFWNRTATLLLPGTLKYIGNSAFYGWSSLIELVIPDSVEIVEPNAFMMGSTNALKKATLGAGLKKLGGYACSSWSICQEIIMLAPTPPEISSSTFNNLNSVCVIKVPSASLLAYKAAPGWSVHAGKMIGV